METRKTHSTPRAGATQPTHRALDDMTVRGAGEVLGILRATEPRPEGGHPIGLWKTGWLAQPEGAA